MTIFIVMGFSSHTWGLESVWDSRSAAESCIQLYLLNPMNRDKSYAVLERQLNQESK